jgi:hypothetical protein
MKLYIQIIYILVIFLKTETLLSDNSLFNVNNIQLEKNDKTTNNSLANQAIKKGFDQLIKKILLKEDINDLKDLKFSSIKKLVTYYQISDASKNKDGDLVNFSVTFDKDKIHELFYKRGISYSEILDRELFIMPIHIRDNEIFVFNNNFFYKNWSQIYEVDLIEFILPLENIEIIQTINKDKNNLINIELNDLFKEYSKKNLAVVIIEDYKTTKKIFIKTRIQGKSISKSLNLKIKDFDKENINKDIIIFSKEEIINLVKSENLIDIRTPSFLNIKLNLNKKTNLVVFNSRIKNIDSIENIFVKEFNKDYMKLRIKYLGKLEKIINQLNNENINLQLNKDEWVIKIL